MYLSTEFLSVRQRVLLFVNEHFFKVTNSQLFEKQTYKQQA